MSWYEIFPKILNMSLTASVIILFVMVFRLLLKRTPKIYSYVLWSVVLFRLLCPVALSAPVSVLGIFDTPVVEQMADDIDKKTIVTSTVEYIPLDIVHTQYPELIVPAPVVGKLISDAVNEKLPQGEEQLGADPLEAPITILTYLWMGGILVLLTYGIISYVKLRQTLLGALRLRDNIYVADHISCPFVLGILKPTIYLPSGLEEKEQVYIVLHEQHHIRRRDHLFKMLAFLVLCIHWFNPLVWVAFQLAVKDMEMSCDEAVINKLGEKVRADYSASLLQLAIGRRIIFGSPLAFGEGEPAGRIRNLARFKRPRIVVTVVAFLLCAVGIMVCIFNPATPKDLLQMTEQHSGVNGNRVKYEVELGNQVGSAILYAEQWIDGTCTRSSQVTLTKNVKSLQVLMKERKNDGVLSGIDIQIDTEEVAGSVLTYFAFPKDHTTVGWAFKAYEENEKLRVVPGEEKILAAMVFDEGDGVRVFDCETLQSEPERMENADHMILVWAVFNEEIVEESRSEEAKEEAKEQLDVEQSVGTEVNAETYPAQWKLIAQQKDVWHTYMDYANDLQQYTIADLDRNGRLEVIVSNMGGTGSYSYTRFFEVNESFDGLVECTTDFVEGDSQPDFLISNEPGQVFRDAEGILHYIMRDFLRVGTEYYNTMYGVVLKEGHISHQTLAQMYESYSTGSSAVEYYNAKGEKITEAEYLSAAETFFDGMSALTYTFDWRNLEEIEDADAEEIYTILSEIRSGIIRSNRQVKEKQKLLLFGGVCFARLIYFKANHQAAFFCIEAAECTSLGNDDFRIGEVCKHHIFQGLSSVFTETMIN